MPKPGWMRELTYWINNRDGRDRRITLAAIHESVGATDALSLAKFCARAGVSYHAAADNEKIVYMVPRSWDAWHLRNGNPRSDGLCLCTPVRGYSPAEWLGPQRRKLDIAAWWLSIVCADRGIDLARCTHQNIRDALRGSVPAGGAIEHHDYTLATRDGNHIDPRGWDDAVWDYVLTVARGGTTTAPGGIETMAFDDTYTDWAGNTMTVKTWMDLQDKRSWQGIDRHEHIVKRIDETARAILHRWEKEDERHVVLTARLDEIEAKLSAHAGGEDAPKA